MSIRLLFVTSDKYPPMRPAAKFLFGRELPKRDVKVDWLIQSDSPEPQARKIESETGTVYLAKTNRSASRAGKVLKHLWDIANDFRVFSLVFSNKYDVIQVKDKYLGALTAALAARLTGAKFCFWIAYPHSEASLAQARSGFAKFRYFSFVKGWIFGFCLYSFICKFADVVFVQSEQMKKDMAKRGVDEHKMVPVPGSVDIEEIDTILSNLAPPSERNKRVLYVGTLMRIRKLDMLIDAFSDVLSEHPDATLDFLGKGEHPKDEELLMSRIRTLGLDNSVRLLGNHSYEEVIKNVSNSAVCLSPYYPSFILNSTSPTKLLEYMAVGRPVVGNVHPEQSDVMKSCGCGECVEWDAEEFAAAIVRLLNDPDSAEAAGGKGRDYILEHRTHRTMGEKVEAVYLELLGKKLDSASSPLS
ncbi:MAG: glycosyltransferase [Pseudomonadota bacterium]